MEEMIKLLYIAYLAKHMGTRMAAISKLVNHHEGKEFFEQYSTSCDSILKFLNKLEAKGLKW